MRVLFIGNSHTYFNDMPEIFAELARKKGIACEVTMITHGGWFLHQHQKEPEVRFNILYGNYDYVVLQEHAHPFGPKEDMLEAAMAINQWIQEAGQRKMTEAYREMAEQLGAVLAPVGEEWWQYKQAHPETEMYAPDGEHASETGSRLAAEILLRVILEHDAGKGLTADRPAQTV